jgi:hypothetical protein
MSDRRLVFRSTVIGADCIIVLHIAWSWTSIGNPLAVNLGDRIAVRYMSGNATAVRVAIIALTRPGSGYHFAKGIRRQGF